MDVTKFLPARRWLAASIVGGRVRRCWRRIGKHGTALGHVIMNTTEMRAYRDALRTAPLRAGGIVVVVAVLMNLLCLWLLGRGVDEWGILVRMACLGLGVIGWSHTGRWAAVKQGSVVIRFVERIGQ